MANHFRLFGRPLMADEVEPAMTVTGLLEGYTAGEAYESRLDINNSRGRCTVEVLSSNLPAGAFVRVDNVTKEVVVKWAPFEEVVGERLVPNGGFESGDDGTWTKEGRNNGEGWTIGSAGYDTEQGSYSARFDGVNSKASDLFCTHVPAEPNDSIRLVGQVQQGASAKGNAGAQVGLVFYDIEGNVLLRKDGNMVSSGSGGRWNPSVVEAVGPTNTHTVRAVITGFRKRERKPVWVDSLTWNHRYTLGQNDDETYTLSIKVTDAENRVAYWSGVIEELGVFLTSTLYPFYAVEELQVSPDFSTYRLLESPSDYEELQVVPGFVSFEPRSVLQQYDAGFEAVRAVPSMVSLIVDDILVTYGPDFEALQATPALQSFTIKAHPALELEYDSVQVTPAFVSWS